MADKYVCEANDSMGPGAIECTHMDRRIIINYKRSDGEYECGFAVTHAEGKRLAIALLGGKT